MKSKIPEPLDIPFFDHEDSLFGTIQNSARRRSISIIRFIYRKIRNIILYRLSFFCPLNSLRIKMHKWRGIKIGKGAYVAQQVILDNAYPEYIFIGDYAAINQGVTILTHNNVRDHFEGLIRPQVAPVIIGKRALVGINATILPGIKIGKFAMISAGSIVIHDVPDYTLVQGNPAKKVIHFQHLLKNLSKYEEQ